MTTSPSRWSAGCFGLGFVLFWSAMSLGVDGFLLWRAVRQIVALGYPSVRGMIRESKVSTEWDEGAMMCGVEVLYDYSIDGWGYTGDRYRYGAGQSSDTHAATVVARLPPGTVVDVYYNPRDPADSCLLRGIEGHDLFLFMFMMPFNVFMILGWVAVATWRWSGESRSGAAAIRVNGPCTRLRLNDSQSDRSPIGFALVTAGGLSFVLVFPIGFSGLGFHPPLELMLGVWVFILVASALVFCWRRRRIASGVYDFVIDEEENTLSLPIGFGRKLPETISIAAVQGVEIENRSKSDSDGIRPNHAVVLAIASPQAPLRRETLVEWDDPARAERFADWLRERLAMMEAHREIGHGGL